MIKSTDAEVRTLAQALGSSDETTREAAVARLIILGNRTMTRLVATFEATSDRDTQLAILRVLEVIGDSRALPLARRAIGRGGDLAVGAVPVLQELLGRGTGPSHAEALDVLLSVANDTAAERRVRTAAMQALAAAPADIRAALEPRLEETVSTDEALWQDAAEGRLPDDPRPLKAAAAAYGERAPLAVLRRLIESVREREGEAGAGRREDWRALRGALHQAVALRGSRIALYDLRETVEGTTEPLPSSFLAAMQIVGDASCLEPLAVAHARATDHQSRWRHQLEQAFRIIAKRGRLTTKHAPMRRALAKSPALRLGVRS